MKKIEYTDYDNFKEQTFKDNEELKKIYDITSFKYRLIKEVLKYRSKYNLTQTDFAKKIGVSQQEISRFEKGKMNPKMDFIEKLLGLLNKHIELV